MIVIAKRSVRALSDSDELLDNESKLEEIEELMELGMQAVVNSLKDKFPDVEFKVENF